MSETKEQPADDRDEVEKIVERAIHDLMEFCDSVRIFATYPSLNKDNITIELTQGDGNKAAQRGQVAAWIIRENEKVRSDVWAELDDADGNDEEES